MGKQEKPLTFKQEKFCKYYVDTEGNASEAYRMSYDASKMKPETIWSAASRLLANSKVSARISEIKQQRAKETEVERKTVEKVLMDIVLADPDDLHYVGPVTGPRFTNARNNALASIPECSTKRTSSVAIKALIILGDKSL